VVTVRVGHWFHSPPVGDNHSKIRRSPSCIAPLSTLPRPSA
jgi:hypothetical protein